MRRRALLTLAWLPCALCAAAWPTSYAWQLHATLARVGALQLSHGAAYAGGHAGADPAPPTITPAPPVPAVEAWVGVSVDRRLPFRALTVTPIPWIGGPPARVYIVPLWVPTLALALPPLWLTRHHFRQRHRPPPNHCAHCGYDLRATPDRCPECGTLPVR